MSLASGGREPPVHTGWIVIAVRTGGSRSPLAKTENHHCAPAFGACGRATHSLSSLPVAASCSHTLPSNPADTTVLPSGFQPAVYAGPVTFSNTTFLPVSVSYTRISPLPSSELA